MACASGSACTDGVTTSRIPDAGAPAAQAHPGRARLITATLIASIAVVVFIPGLIDPVEGSIPVVLGGLLLLAAWLIGRVPMPPLAWIAWVITFASGAITLAVVGIWPELTAEVRGLGPFSLPPAILVPLIVYELGVVTTIVGAVWNASRIGRAARHHPR